MTLLNKTNSIKRNQFVYLLIEVLHAKRSQKSQPNNYQSRN